MSAINEYKKLQTALSTIKEECRGHGTSCCACPFEVGGKCGITGESAYTGSNMENKVKSWWAVYRNHFSGGELRAIVHARSKADAEAKAFANGIIKNEGGKVIEWWQLLRVAYVTP